MAELASPVSYRIQPTVFQPINPVSYFNRQLPEQAPIPVDKAAKAGVFSTLMKTLGDLPKSLVDNWEAGKKRGTGEIVRQQFTKAVKNPLVTDPDTGKPVINPALFDFKADASGAVTYSPQDPEIRRLQKLRYGRLGTGKPSAHDLQAAQFGVGPLAGASGSAPTGGTHATTSRAPGNVPTGAERGVTNPLDTSDTPTPAEGEEALPNENPNDDIPSANSGVIPGMEDFDPADVRQSFNTSQAAPVDPAINQRIQAAANYAGQQLQQMDPAYLSAGNDSATTAPIAAAPNEAGIPGLDAALENFHAPAAPAATPARPVVRATPVAAAPVAATAPVAAPAPAPAQAAAPLVLDPDEGPISHMSDTAIEWTQAGRHFTKDPSSGRMWETTPAGDVFEVNSSGVKIAGQTPPATNEPATTEAAVDDGLPAPGLANERHSRPLDALSKPEIRRATAVPGRYTNPDTGEMFIASSNGTIKTMDPYTQVITLHLPGGREYQLLPGANSWKPGEKKEDHSELEAIADAIIRGEMPPDLKGFYKQSVPLRAILARKGYDLTTATKDWMATQRNLASMNSPGQLRVRQSVDNAYHSLEIVEELGRKWAGGKYPLLNRARLNAAKQGLLGPEAQSLAQRLDGEIKTMVSELANVFQGGNAPTHHAMELAAETLKAEFSEKTFMDSINTLRRNLKIRQNSMDTIDIGGASPTNAYGPKAGTPGAGQSVAAPAPAAVNAPAAEGVAKPSEGMVRMKHPNGTDIYVPREKVSQAEQMGATVIQ